MLKKLILGFVIIIFFSTCKITHAALLINEVMYDISGADSINSKSREWIEIYNNGSGDIVVDGSWRIYDGSANRTINDQNSLSIPAGAFVVFAGDKDTFLSDHVGFSGVVYDTGITTLSNTGAILKIIDVNSLVVDSFTYSSPLGAAGDGNSLQKISGSFVSAAPTPGITNENIAPPTLSSPSPSTSTTTTTTTTMNTGGNGEDPSLKYSKKEQKIKTKIITKSLVFAGAPIEIKASATGLYGEPIPYGKYFWNFGDGDSKEVTANQLDKFSHTYFYPGEYSINLEYYMNLYGESPDAVDKVTLRVVEPQVVISGIGDNKDFYIELTNKGDYDADISRWILVSGNRSFVFPKNTIINPQDKMKISPRVSFFNEDKNILKLMTPQSEVVSDYFNITADGLEPTQTKENKIVKNIILGDKTDKVLKINEENLSATALPAAIPENNSNTYTFGGVLAIFLLCTSGAVYFIRRKKISTEPGGDFELLDE